MFYILDSCSSFNLELDNEYVKAVIRTRSIFSMSTFKSGRTRSFPDSEIEEIFLVELMKSYFFALAKLIAKRGFGFSIFSTGSFSRVGFSGGFSTLGVSSSECLRTATLGSFSISADGLFISFSYGVYVVFIYDALLIKYLESYCQLLFDLLIEYAMPAIKINENIL